MRLTEEQKKYKILGIERGWQRKWCKVNESRGKREEETKNKEEEKKQNKQRRKTNRSDMVLKMK